MKKLLVVMIAVVLVGSAVSPAAAASDTASITGRVTDATGSPLAGVTVYVTPDGTTGTLTTTAAGTFAAKGLPAGDVQLRFYLEGYTQVTTNVTVSAGEKSTGNGVALTQQAKITGRLSINGVPALGELGLVAVKLYDAAGGIVYGEGAERGTFKIYNLPAGDYRLEFCPGYPTDFIDCSSRPVSVADGEQKTGLSYDLAGRAGVEQISYVDGTISPATVAHGKNVRVTGVVRSYGAVALGRVELLHHSRTVKSRPVGSDSKVTFTLDSDAWGNKKGTHAYRVKLTFTGTAEAKKAVDYPTFRIR